MNTICNFKFCTSFFVHEIISYIQFAILGSDTTKLVNVIFCDDIYERFQILFY